MKFYGNYTPSPTTAMHCSSRWFACLASTGYWTCILVGLMDVCWLALGSEEQNKVDLPCQEFKYVLVLSFIYGSSSPTCMVFVGWIYTSDVGYSCFNIANSMNPYWVFILNLKEILPEAKWTLSVQNYVSLLAQQHNLLPKPEFSIGPALILVCMMFLWSIDQAFTHS